MNKYEILGVVGEGAYGIVLKCRNKDTGDTLAIKKFKDTEDDEIILKNTQREIKMLKLLKYEHVVDLKEAFKRKGRIYLVFEFVDKNLLEVLEEKPQGLDSEFIKKIIYQLIKSLDFCHKHNVIHRDIKPENLLINNDGTLKLCDFGFARFTAQKGEQLTDYVATRWYRAPELILGDHNYGSPIDLWAVACIMGELIDGQPLFPGENEVDQLYQIQKVLGNLTDTQKEILNKNPRFIGVKIPEVNKPETLDRIYLGKTDKKALQFMKALLKMDPNQRLNCQQALQHPYFETINNDLKKSQMLQVQKQSSGAHSQIQINNDELMQQAGQLQKTQYNHKTQKQLDKPEQQQIIQNINLQNMNLYNLNINENIQQNQYNFNLQEQKNKKQQYSQQNTAQKFKTNKFSNNQFEQSNIKFNHTQYIKPNNQNYNKINYNHQFQYQSDNQKPYKMGNKIFAEFNKQQQMLPMLNMNIKTNKNQVFNNNFNVNKTMSKTNLKGQHQLNQIYKPLKNKKF